MQIDYGLSPDMVAFQGFHPSLYPYFHVSVGGVETTVASEHTDSTDDTVAETTVAVVPELTTESAVEGKSPVTHCPLDKMAAISQTTFYMHFYHWKVLYFDSNFT